MKEMLIFAVFSSMSLSWEVGYSRHVIINLPQNVIHVYYYIYHAESAVMYIAHVYCPWEYIADSGVVYICAE